MMIGGVRSDAVELSSLADCHAQLEVAEIRHHDRVRDKRSPRVLDLDLQTSRGSPRDAFARMAFDQEVFELKDRRDVRVEVVQAQVIEVVN